MLNHCHSIWYRYGLGGALDSAIAIMQELSFHLGMHHPWLSSYNTHLKWCHMRPAVPVPPLPPANWLPPMCSWPSHFPCFGPPGAMSGGRWPSGLSLFTTSFDLSRPSSNRRFRSDLYPSRRWIPSWQNPVQRVRHDLSSTLLPFLAIWSIYHAHVRLPPPGKCLSGSNSMTLQDLQQWCALLAVG